MKKLIAVIAGAFIIFSASSFAYKAPENSTERVATVFNSTFSGATNVTWTERSTLYFADFIYEGKNMSAAYDSDGKLLGTSRAVTKAEVPEKLLKRAEGNFRNGKSAPYVIELTYKGETSYYFDIVTDKYVIYCNADGDGVITETGRMKLQQ